jgi:hypothetical protein
VLCGRRLFFGLLRTAPGDNATAGNTDDVLAFSPQYQRLRFVWKPAPLAAAFRLLRVTVKLAILAFERPLAKIAPAPI